MKRNVQLPYELFVALIKFHLFQDDDYADEIATGLEQKLDALVRHGIPFGRKQIDRDSR